MFGTSPMRLVRGVVRTLVVAGLCAACSASEGSKVPPGGQVAPTRAGPPARLTGTVIVNPERTLTPMPLAVRVLSADPRDIVLRVSDLPPGFHISADYQVSEVELWPARRPVVEPRPNIVQNPARRSTGTGRHAALTRSDGTVDADGLVSIATTAVRYESTWLAVDAFARSLPTSVTRQDPAALNPLRSGDDVSTWSYRLSGVSVDQMLIRTRNYVLALILVRRPPAGEPHLVAHYARVMRSKLPD
jgi:hypothetical protein